jgi:transposase-like protein
MFDIIKIGTYVCDRCEEDFMNLESITLEQFQLQYGTEEACAEYLFHAKWPTGYSCPRCGHRHAYKTITRRLPLYECCHCHHQASLTAGTILEGSRTDLHKWFIAFFLISRTEQGTSAVDLSKIIKVTYKTAWLILQKIRHIMSTADKETLLSGIVRINSAVYGRPYHPSIHPHPQEHPLLIGSSINGQGDPIYVKMKLVSRSQMRERQIPPVSTLEFTHLHVEQHTNDIQIITGRFSPNRFRKLLVTVGELSKWINNTFHGLGRRHLQAYMDEFGYRLNHLLQNTPIFSHLTNLCATTASITYKSLTRRIT